MILDAQSLLSNAQVLTVTAPSSNVFDTAGLGVGQPVTNIFGVALHDLDELGEGQDYQNFFTSSAGLAGAVQTSDLELVIGIDQAHNDSFVMPVKMPLQVFEDPHMHRQQRTGYYGWAELGFACLDNRRVILGSF